MPKFLRIAMICAAVAFSGLVASTSPSSAASYGSSSLSIAGDTSQAQWGPRYNRGWRGGPVYRGYGSRYNRPYRYGARCTVVRRCGVDWRGYRVCRPVRVCR